MTFTLFLSYYEFRGNELIMKSVWYIVLMLVSIIIGGLGFFMFGGGLIGISSGRMTTTIFMLAVGLLMMGLAVFIFKKRNNFKS